MNDVTQVGIPTFNGTKKTYEQWLALHPLILEHEIAKATGRIDDAKRIYEAISGGDAAKGKG